MIGCIVSISYFSGVCIASKNAVKPKYFHETVHCGQLDASIKNFRLEEQ